jgi:hypothetical protein
MNDLPVSFIICAVFFLIYVGLSICLVLWEDKREPYDREKEWKEDEVSNS